MSSRSLLLTALLSLPVAGLAWLAIGDEQSQATASSRLPADLIRRAESLSSSDPRVRARAEDDLLRAGTAGVERMLAALPPDGFAPEDRAAVLRLREQLKRLVTETEAAAVLVTTPRTVETMADMESCLDRAGNHVRLTAAQESRPVRLSFDSTPFWQAVDDAATKAGLAPDAIRETGSAVVLTFRDRSAADELTAVGYAGPCRLTAELERADARDVGPGQPARIRLGLMGEPRLRPLTVSCDAAGFSLADPDGTIVATADRLPNVEFSWADDSGTARLSFAIALPSDPPPLTLTGRLDVVAVTATEWLSFHFDEADIAQDANGIEARISAARFDREAAEIEIAFACPDPPSALLERGVVACDHTPAALYHAGSPSASVDVSLPVSVQADEHEGEFRVRYRFEGLPGDPAYVALVCRVPRRVARLSVPVEIKGLQFSP